MRARALALLLTLALLPLFVARAASAQNADAGAAVPSPTNTTRPSLVPDATPSATTTAPPPTTTAIPAATTPTPQVRPSVSATGDTKAQPAKSGNEGEVAANPSEVFSEDWWGRTRPVFEIHGYFRTRAE